MSDMVSPLRIRAQPSPSDPDTLRFLLDAPVQDGAVPATFDGTTKDVPLARALFDIGGVHRVEVDSACIHIRKSADARWEDIKAPIAAAIRAVLASTEQPLGAQPKFTGGDRDAWMLAAVRDLLDSRINPSIAGHGGHIDIERVTDGTAYLRMSGACQGCAASQLTLRGGVERTMRAALPGLHNIVDVTDRAGPALSPIAGPVSEMPPSDVVPVVATSDEDPSLAIRIRSHLEALAPSAPTISYGALARVLGLWQPGSARRITRALEDTMREDAHAGRPFIVASVVSRATYGLPAKGFFDLARDLSQGHLKNDTERAFHAREMERLEHSVIPHS